MPDIQNKQDYELYCESVAQFIEREQIAHFSTSTAETCGGEESDPWFSGHPCECCRSHLGGNREYLYARYLPTDEIVQFEVCEDCVYYLNYGRLDDATMERVEHGA